MKFRNSLYALAIAGACSVSVSSVCAQGFTAQNYAFASSAAGFMIPFDTGIEFTTGPSSAQISSVVLEVFDMSFSPASGIFNVSLWSSTGGVPSSLISSDIGVSYTTAGSFASTSAKTLTSSDLPNLSAVPLSATSTYMLVFSNQTSFNFGILFDPGVTYATSGSWTVNGSYRKSSGTWQNFSSGNFAISINPSSPSPVPEASGSVAGLGLAMAGLYQLRRRRQNTVTQ